LKLHSVFLRKGSKLPAHFDLLREPYGINWTLLEEVDAQIFDTMIRQAVWHFHSGRVSCSRIGVGGGPDEATSHALTRALKGIPAHFNAAELTFVQVAKRLGFHLATVVLQPRLVLRFSPLDRATVDHPRIIPAR
jgi:hypothetical protein